MITKNSEKTSGHDEIRTHDLPVISRAHHLAMLRALVLYYVGLTSIYIIRLVSRTSGIELFFQFFLYRISHIIMWEIMYR